MSSSQTTASPYGSWKSPITSDLIVAGTLRLDEPRFDTGGSSCFWLEGRPTEGGRYVLVNEEGQDVIPKGFNVRTRVHEYGGGSYIIHNKNTVYFSNFADQRIYTCNAAAAANGKGEETPPKPLTKETENCGLRYADYEMDETRNRILVVREDHTLEGKEAVNTIAAVSLADGSETVLAQGHDFYSSPKLSPDGKSIAFFTWDHPNMPWDGTQLWVARVLDDDSGKLDEPQLITGGANESVQQPTWSPDGTLYFISDGCKAEGACAGWWNIYRHVNGKNEVVCPKPVEFGVPHWRFDTPTFGFVSADTLVCTFSESGKAVLATLDTKTLEMTRIDNPYHSTHSIRVATDGTVLMDTGSPTIPACIVKMSLNSNDSKILKSSSDVDIDSGYLSVPEIVEFPTENNKTAFGLYYSPTNKDFVAPEGDLPPLIVQIHGGPTSSTSSVFNLKNQYWTSRGFAILDVDYGGSTGYGREYRDRLKLNWGIVDVDDCCNGAKFLEQQKKADGKRLCVQGGSAGGYTTLAALAFRNDFSGGASYYGVADCEVLASDTHKFESRYLDSLMGPYPEKKQVYIDRSPIHAVDKLSCPVIFFQGDEDKIVPPNQAELMVEALKKNNLPVAYILYEGEQHGFRQAKNIKRTLDGELYFYSRVFKFELADKVDPVEIDNLD
jgi:dipeptidyl aminopeptidase/acylaminoacyl peptidase